MPMEFRKRTTAPDRADKNYYSNDNIFFASGYGMPNCTAYAWGRLKELTNKKWNTLYRNAGSWYADAVRSGLKVGSVPKLGAVACWGTHVAIVEEIKDNGDIICSNSAFKATEFYLTEHTKASNYSKNGATIQGFIYCGIDFVPAIITTGRMVTLKGTPCYSQAYASSSYGKKSGTYFIWSAETINGRVRITSDINYVGKSGKVTCWVSVADLGFNDTPTAQPSVRTLQVGDTVMLAQGAKFYDGKQPKDYVYKRKHKVKSIANDRVVITYLGIVVGAVNVKDLLLS